MKERKRQCVFVGEVIFKSVKKSIRDPFDRKVRKKVWEDHLSLGRPLKFGCFGSGTQPSHNTAWSLETFPERTDVFTLMSSLWFLSCPTVLLCPSLTWSKTWQKTVTGDCLIHLLGLFYRMCTCSSVLFSLCTYFLYDQKKKWPEESLFM